MKQAKSQHLLRLLLVDFDGVMSNGKFYNTTLPEERSVARQAVAHIFSRENSKRLDDWMRGRYSFRQLHREIEQRTGIQADRLDALLIESVRRMPLNQPMLTFIKQLRQKGVIVSLFTNNMDIFDTVSRTFHQLDDHFDYIYSSSAHQRLKLEDNYMLTKASRDASANIGEIALVDDSQYSYDVATSFGVPTFLYTHYTDSQPAFEKWLSRKYTV